MADIANILNDDEFFGDIVNITKESTDKHRKQECLKSIINKVYLLGSKWTKENVDKASYEIINKMYAAYKQRELNEKGEKTGKALDKHVINLYSTGISRVAKISNVKNLKQNIENDPIIKDQMANLSCLLVCTIGDYLAPTLVTVNPVNNLGPGDELENEGYESG